MSSALLPNTGFLRWKQIKQLFPVSRTVWYEGVKNGRYPKPVKQDFRRPKGKSPSLPCNIMLLSAY